MLSSSTSSARRQMEQQQRFYSKDRRHHIRGGSLPLKKRRVCLGTEYGFSLLNHNNNNDHETTNTASNCSEDRKLAYLPSASSIIKDFSKMNALSLIAAAAANETAFYQLHQAQEQVPEEEDYDDDDEEGESTCSDEEDSSSDQQLHLPSGCHGKTSRNNSYCRRQPCYNGSNFCKLHYQQQRNVKKNKSSSSKVSHAPVQATAASHSAVVPVPTTPTTTTAKAASATGGQDKHYTGLDTELRCLATTTRGRACAYIAVQKTKYCFLHADYDTNPPPRRKSKGEIMMEAAAASALAEGDSDERAVSPVPSPIPDKAAAASSGNCKKRCRRTSAKLAEKHADSPRPLLSMIATDQWFGKSVKIATGPLEGRVGVVEKWGNGWVSVNVAGVGLHNRRSFELYLDAEPDEFVEENQLAQVEEDRNLQLFRCVSRDMVSPSPSTDSSIKSLSGERAVTPKTSRSPPLHLEALVSPDNKARVLTDTPRPAFVRGVVSYGSETPVPLKTTVDATMSLEVPKVTPHTEKSMAMPRHSMKDKATFDLQLPEDSDKRTKGMVFWPSMGERTRGRAGSSTDLHEDDSTAAATTTTATVLPKKRRHVYLEENYSYGTG